MPAKKAPKASKSGKTRNRLKQSQYAAFIEKLTFLDGSVSDADRKKKEISLDGSSYKITPTLKKLAEGFTKGEPTEAKAKLSRTITAYFKGKGKKAKTRTDLLQASNGPTEVKIDSVGSVRVFCAATWAFPGQKRDAVKGQKLKVTYFDDRIEIRK